MALPAPRDCREEFKATATLYRKRTRLFAYLFFATFALTLLGFVLKNGLVVQVGVIGGFVVVGVSLAFLIPKLACPQCRRSLEETPENYCPECGVPALKQPKFLFTPRCTACDKRLARGRGGRRYKIRFCHLCGSHVHDRGV